MNKNRERKFPFLFMKTILSILLIIISLGSYSQTSLYGGIWNHQGKAAPFVYVELEENQSYGFSYSPIFGAGLNSVNQLTGVIGFDTKLGYSEIQPIVGFGVEFFGWDRVHQDYMPNFRAGVRYKRFRLLSSIHWNFKEVETKWGPASQPGSRLTYGIFYDFK